LDQDFTKKASRNSKFFCPLNHRGSTGVPFGLTRKGTLIAGIAQRRRWLKELIEDPAATTESIANRATCSVRKVNMTISLAFLVPELAKVAKTHAMRPKAGWATAARLGNSAPL
jgi:hypothetical protein